MAIGKKQFFKKSLTNIVILLMPPSVTVSINLLLYAAKASLAFGFYWSIIMGYLIFPRLENFRRLIDFSYLPVILVLLGFYFVSCLTIAKLSKKTFHEKWFLYSFPIATLASIFPRWSDFRLQPFVFFLAIIFTYALSLSKLLNGRDRLYFVSSQIILYALMFVLLGNRILSEIRLSKSPRVDFVAMFTESGLADDLKGKNVFAYENPFFNFNLENKNNKYDSISLSKLIITDPDLYYYNRGPQVALSYLLSKNPDYLFLLPKTRERITTESKLTDVEKFIVKNYKQKSKIDPLYFVYERKD